MKFTSVLNLKKKTKELKNEYFSSIEENELETLENSFAEIEEQLEELEVKLLNFTNPSSPNRSK